MRAIKLAAAAAAVAALASVAALWGREPSGVQTASVAAPSAVRVLYVQVREPGAPAASGDGSVDAPWSTLTEALRRAPAGVEIRVGPGEYRERLAVTRSVTLVGAGAFRTRIVAPSAGGTTIAMVGAPTLSLRGIAVEGGDIGIDATDARDLSLSEAALRGQASFGLRARGTAVSIEDSEILDISSGWKGIGLELTRSTLQLRSTVLRRAGRRAVVVRGGTAVLTDVDAQGSSLSALQATDRAEVEVRRGLFTANGGAALYAGGATLRVADARVERNEMGIVGFRGARVDVEGTQLYDHAIAAVAINSGPGSMRRCIVARGGTDAAVAISASPGMIIEDTVIFDPGPVGIRVTRSKAMLKGNDIRGARLDRQRDFGDAIYAVQSDVFLRGNVLRSNVGNGLTMMRSTARLHGNDLLSNGRSGAALGGRSHVDAVGNLFDGNRGSGLEVSESSVIKLRRNRFASVLATPIEEFCGEPGRRGTAEVDEGNTFVGVARTRCL